VIRSRALFAGVLVLIGTVAFACAPGGSSSGRQVLVDYNNPDFANIAIAYFPDTVNVHPGDIVHFKQAWNGEPHSVTMGTLVDRGLDIVNPLLPQLNGNGPPPADVQAKADAAFEHLPDMFNGDTSSVNQPAAQPCFIDKGGVPPSDSKKPCPRRAQPVFNGTQAYYSSGFIPYAGNNGNSFDVKLSKDIKPGTYHYYCTYHGPQMQGRIIVKPASATIPSQGDVDRAALSQAASRTAPVKKALDKVDGLRPFDIIKAADIAGFEPPPTDNQKAKLKGAIFAGYSTQNSDGVLANEFVPRTVHAKVGQKVTWAFVGLHTVSFDVPRYFPFFKIANDGTVSLDRRFDSGAGPKFPATYPDGAGDTYILDGGTWKGTGFYSSGLLKIDSGSNVIGYSLAFSQPGTYQYACLIHPKMVGTVVVK
jgi:plastocyanin